MSSLKPISALLTTGNNQLSQLIKKANELQHLTDLLLTHLDEPLRYHCQVVGLKDGCLTIIADSAVWTTQLRYLSPDLIQKLHQHTEFRDLLSIRCHVDTPNTP